MTHRGPFQPLLFCDSVILCVHPVPTGLGLWFVATRSFPPAHRPRAGASPLLPAAPTPRSLSPWGPGLHRAARCSALPAPPAEMLQSLAGDTPLHPALSRTLCPSAQHPRNPHALGPSSPLAPHHPFAIHPPGAPGWGHGAGSPGYHLREPRWPPRHAICSATFGDRAGAAVFLGHVSSLPPAAWSRLSVF